MRCYVLFSIALIFSAYSNAFATVGANERVLRRFFVYAKLAYEDSRKCMSVRVNVDSDERCEMLFFYVEKIQKERLLDKLNPPLSNSERSLLNRGSSYLEKYNRNMKIINKRLRKIYNEMEKENNKQYKKKQHYSFNPQKKKTEISPGIRYTAHNFSVISGGLIKLTIDNIDIKTKLYGIECPQEGHPYYDMVTQATKRILTGRIVEFIPIKKDQHGRLVANVYVDNANLSELLVRNGYCCVSHELCRTEICRKWMHLENKVRAANKGIHQ